MHVVEYPVNDETWLDWPKNSGEFYVVYSADKTNGMHYPTPHILMMTPILTFPKPGANARAIA